MEDTPLHTIVERVAENARENLLRDGQHTTILILMGQEKAAIAALALPLGDPGQERMKTFREVGRTIGESYGPEIGPLSTAVHISEAWGRELQEGETREYKHLENDPKREEVLVVTGYKPATDETLMRTFLMSRDIEGRLVAVEPKTLAEGNGVKAYLLEAFCEGFNTAFNAKQS